MNQLRIPVQCQGYLCILGCLKMQILDLITIIERKESREILLPEQEPHHSRDRPRLILLYF